MLRNYFKIAFRSLVKQKLYSVINIFGLAIGLTCCLLIMLYVMQELSFDKFHENADRIYRVGVVEVESTGKSYTADTPAPLAPALSDDYPEIEHYTRFSYSYDDLFYIGDDKFFDKSQSTAFVDSSFFDVFTYEVIEGDKAAMLNAPNKIVLTESAVERLFAGEDPIGKTINMNKEKDLIVTGVIKDPPVNSHMKFDKLISFTTLDGSFMNFPIDSWGVYSGLITYVLLPENTSAKAFEEKAYKFMDKHENYRANAFKHIFLFKMSDIHLYSDYSNEISENNRISNLYIVSTIALFILLIACINFMNLATARSAKRAREVGVRKVLGAYRRQLIQQFIGESLIITFLSLILSFVLMEVAMPYFSNLVNIQVENLFLTDPFWFTALVLFGLVVGLAAGFYPALFLSRYKPVKVLKGNSTSAGASAGGTLIRKGLVVVQFVISVILIIGTFVVVNQHNYMLNKALGFDKEHNIEIRSFTPSTEGKYLTIKNELQNVSGVKSVTASFSAPVSDWGLDTSIFPEGIDGETRFGINGNFVDEDYIPHFGLELIAGRNFDDRQTDEIKDQMIINETTMRMLGYHNPEEILGKRFQIGINRLEPEVIGVVKDYHIESLHEKIEPLMLLWWTRFYYHYNIKIASADVIGTVDEIKDVWTKFDPDYPIQYHFLDDYINSLYESEARTLNIIATFSGLAIFIACLGLFALAAFTAEQRTKEIGIRRVLGATVSNIVMLLTQDFLKLVAISALISMPIAYYVMNEWLTEFPYRIEIGYNVFLIALGISLAVAVLTVSYQAVKAALINPAKSIRYE